MSLTPGQDLTHYRILAPLGAGGMGEVWRAQDTRLGREVAIKVLPEHLADDEERLQRFEREARTLASLSHANLAHVYGIDQVGDTCFIAMELVSGEDLAERLARGPLPLGEALDVGRQIAEGLEAAHEAGVVHRDLKPANVRLTPEGTVKILDFGLAKPTRPRGAAQGSTSAEPDSFLATADGVVLGTPTYMSPEQARGRAVDRRTDVWAFGCVLFECLTGKRAFDGETIADVIARVLEEEPDWRALPGGLPSAVRDLLERCLDKEPRSRLRDVGEARVRLERAANAPATEVAADRASTRAPSAPVLAALAGVVALGAGFLGWSLRSSEAVRAAPLRKLELESSIQPLSEAVLSPDGTRIALVAAGRLWVRHLDELEPRELPETEGARFVFWSPDGRELGYIQQRRLWRSPPDGRIRTPLADLDAGWVNGAGAHWTEDGRIVFSRGASHLFELPIAGGAPRILLEAPDPEQEHFHDPRVLPGAVGIVFATHGPTGVDTLELMVGEERSALLHLPGALIDNPRYSPTGHILFTRGPEPAGIWALPFSLERLAVTGEPFVVSPGGSHPSLAADGSLLFRGGRSSLLRQLVWADREGNVVGEVGEPLHDPRTPRLSPDGRWVVVSAYEGGTRSLWLIDVERGGRRQLTFGAEADRDPSWQGDRRVLFTRHGENDIQACAIEIDAKEVELLHGRRGGEALAEGRHRVYHQRGEIWVDDGTPSLFHTSAVEHRWPVISPGGDFVVFGSDTTARGALTLRRFPTGSGEWQIHSDGGSWCRWSPAGDELFFTTSGILYVMRIDTGEEVTFDTPERLFGEVDQGLICGVGYDVDQQAERILCLRPERLELPTTTLVQSWYAEFDPELRVGEE